MNSCVCKKEQLKSANIKAFLKLVRYAEHKCDGDEVYFYLLGGRLKFYDTDRHPIQKISARGDCPDIAGAYNHKLHTWEEAYKNGFVSDFSPASQDKLAIKRLISSEALEFVEVGDVENAISRLSDVWTALPGARNSNMKMSEARERFDKYRNEFSRQNVRKPYLT